MPQKELETLPKIKTVTIEKKGGDDLVIIGGGPAGLSAGIYAMRMGLNTLLIEGAVAGGLAAASDRIENYPGFPKGIKGIDLCRAFEQQAKELGLEIAWGTVSSIEASGKKKKVFYEDKALETRAVIIATGTQLKKLGVPGEEEFLGRGVSYCATCDAPFYKGKKVAVVGGGNSALEEALFLTAFADMVTVIHRRDKLRADKILELRARNDPKIYFIWESELEKIEGKETVESVTIVNKRTGKRVKSEADGVFIYVGASANTSFLKGLVRADENGFILTDENMKTSLEGVFAAGDVRSKDLRQIVTAAADGAIAAASAHKYIEGLKL